MTQTEKIYDIIQDTDKNYAPYYDVIPGLIKSMGLKTGIEIGVFCGGHARKILDAGVDMLAGIDPYIMYDPGMPRMDSQSDYDMLYNIVSSRLSARNYLPLRMTSNQALSMLEDDTYDFVFIDGLHTYEQLKWDLENYSKLIKSGGVVACHDYNHPFFPDLTIAIDEFVKKYNKKLVIGPLHLVYMIW
jgi:hypothetical protein